MIAGSGVCEKQKQKQKQGECDIWSTFDVGIGETPADGEGKSSWHELLVKIVGVVIARITARSHGVKPRNAYCNTC
jgi:hypothetical protein